jgi:hypothetical protein
VALVLAWNYFAFRVELFDDENEENHPSIDPYSHQQSFTPSTLNWETFDKDNAPKALRIVVDPQIELILRVAPEPARVVFLTGQDNPIRDKSPPFISL